MMMVMMMMMMMVVVMMMMIMIMMMMTMVMYGRRRRRRAMMMLRRVLGGRKDWQEAGVAAGVGRQHTSMRRGFFARSFACTTPLATERNSRRSCELYSVSAWLAGIGNLLLY